MSENSLTEGQPPEVPTSLPDDPEADLPDEIQARREFARTLSTNGYHGVCVLDRKSGREVLSGKRPELIDYLRENEPESVRAVARDLDRYKSNVSDDLAALSRRGVVEYIDGDRGAKAPRLKYSHVVIEPL
jgi:predicted transcriptional regulator